MLSLRPRDAVIEAEGCCHRGRGMLSPRLRDAVSINKLSSQCNLLAQIEQVQDTDSYLSVTFVSSFISLTKIKSHSFSMFMVEFFYDVQRSLT